MQPIPRGFREGLRRELPRWRQDGIVSPDAAAALHVRYDLDREEPGLPSFLVLYVLGALLVGTGVVTLVAWHWEAMGAVPKLAILFGALTGFHAAGYALWKGTGRAPTLGHALTFLGTLVFGASVGLVAQIFHVSGVWWGGFAAVAAGALAAGLLYRSLPHLLLASALGLSVAGVGAAFDHPLPGVALAWALAAGFLLLAWRERSRAVLVATAIGLGAMLASGTLGLSGWDRGGADHALPLLLGLLGAAWMAAPLAVPALAWRGDTAGYLAGAARPLGRVAFYGVAYLLSFADVAHELGLSAVHLRDLPLVTMAGLPSIALAVALLLYGLRRAEVDPLARGEALLALGTAFALGAALSLPGNTGAGAALVANLALAFFAAGRIVRGLAALRRGPFWEGIAVAGVLVLTRFLELEFELWLKGAAFIACGVGVFAAGFAFERRRVHGQEVVHAA
jgi:hypothetical protein